MAELDVLKSKWQEIKDTVKRDHEITDIAFKTWIAPLEVYSVENDIVTILFPSENENDIVENILKNKYNLAFLVAISEIMHKEYKQINFTSGNNSPSDESISSYNNSSNINNIEKSNLNSKYTFDTFVVGSNNRHAHSAALAVSEDPGQVYNPLFIYGGPGLGKTHLMHSIGHYILSKNPKMNVCYVTSETFTNEVIESIRSGDINNMTKLREKYRTVDALLVDDIQFIIGKESTQEEFFHTFNVLHSANKAIILSSDKPPKEIKTLEDRIKSRFNSGLIVDINPPDYETRVAILRKNAEIMHANISDDIINYIATNIKSNIRELEGALNKIVADQSIEASPMTLDQAVNSIKDLITPDEPKKITPKLIIDEVADYYNISPNEILSKKRNMEIVVPRHVAMYLCRSLTDTALAEIGNIMGGRDHTTVIHGCEKIEKELSTDEMLKNTIETLTNKIKSD